MALVLKDRVKETSVSVGTGAMALDGAAGPYSGFSVIGNGNQTYYGIVSQTGTDWEVGIGTYTLAGSTLSRDTILASSNSGNIVTFGAGTKDVFVTYPSQKAIYEEPDGKTLINAGPITVLGSGVSGYTTLNAALGEFYANVNSFAQVYAQNQNNGSDASTDFVVENDNGTDTQFYGDFGINSSGFTSVSYPIYTPDSTYLYGIGDGGANPSNLFLGSGDGYVKIHAGGFDVTDVVATFGTDLSTTLAGALSVTGATTMTGAATFGSTVLLNADPSLNLQAATKQYVDNAVAAGLDIHTPVRLEQGTNLTATYSNGASGVGATLTNSGTQVALSVDGVATVVNDRILVYGQTTATQNGVYTVTNIGSGSTNWVLTRATDADTYGINDPNKLSQGSYFYVTNGLTGAGESYVLTTVGAITFGTTAITFSQFSATPTFTGGTNIDVTGQVISLTGTVAATNGGTGTSTVTTGDLLYGSASNTWSKLGLGAAYRSLMVNAGGTQVEWNALPLNQSAAVSGSLGAVNGGTGQATYATGDTIYASAANTLSKLSGNTTITKQYLSQTGTGSASQAPSWATISAADIGAGTLPATRGGTDNSSYAVGDILYANTTTSLAKLADVATGNVLTSGGVGAAPAWGKVALASAVSGTLGVTNGGTGTTTSTGSGNVVLSTSPTLVTPALGTPSSGNLANCTFPTLNQNTTGNAANVTGVVAVANGGTGNTTAQAAMNTLAGATTSGYYLRGNGTNAVMAAIVAGDVPTLNQNTTGTAGGLSATLAIASGGTGATTAGAALTALGAYPATNPSGYTSNTGTVTSVTGGSYLTGGTITSSGTLAVDATTTNTASKVVARDASGNFSAGTITATLSGNATSATTATSATSATTATTATTANALNTANNYQVNSLGVGTAGSGTAGEIRATNNVTAYYSDDRFKTNLGNIPNALDKVQTLNGFYYEANELAQSYGYEKKMEVGVSAQQVQAIMPEVVAPAPIDENYLTVRYERLVPLLIEAIKELKAEVDLLKGK